MRRAKAESVQRAAGTTLSRAQSVFRNQSMVALAVRLAGGISCDWIESRYCARYSGTQVLSVGFVEAGLDFGTGSSAIHVLRMAISSALNCRLISGGIC